MPHSSTLTTQRGAARRDQPCTNRAHARHEDEGSHTHALNRLAGGRGEVPSLFPMQRELLEGGRSTGGNGKIRVCALCARADDAAPRARSRGAPHSPLAAPRVAPQVVRVPPPRILRARPVQRPVHGVGGRGRLLPPAPRQPLRQHLGARRRLQPLLRQARRPRGGLPQAPEQPGGRAGAAQRGDLPRGGAGGADPLHEKGVHVRRVIPPPLPRRTRARPRGRTGRPPRPCVPR